MQIMEFILKLLINYSIKKCILYSKQIYDNRISNEKNF